MHCVTTMREINVTVPDFFVLQRPATFISLSLKGKFCFSRYDREDVNLLQAGKLQCRFAK
ncbi:hypothetical protein WT33_33240 [Burkholderia stagnalis]|nr:hypothetical protein WT33_33240 [Burkholderia stagnalis]